MRKSLAFILTILLSVTTALIPLQSAHATSFVTETASSITIENDYYKAVIDKTTASFGGITDFYIKPDTTIDIVASGDTHDIIGGHEWGDYNTSVFYDQFSGEVINTNIEVLFHSTEYCIVYCSFEVGTASQNMTVEEWKTFYYNQPYFQVSFKRQYNTELIDVHDDQVCFLFNVDWVEELVFLNETGQIETETQPAGIDTTKHNFNPMMSMEKASSYSWGAYYNSTYDAYFGTIILEVNPRWQAFWMQWDIMGSGNSYSEYQITLDNDGRLRYGNETVYCSYINYVTDDYTDISSLACSLWENTYTEETTNTFWCWADNGMSWSRYKGTPVWSCFGGNTDSAPIYVSFREGWMAQNENAIKISPNFSNDTNNYWLWNVSTVNLISQYNSTSESNLTYSSTFEDKWLVNMTFQFYNDTEIIVVKGYFKALKDVDTRWLRWYVGTGNKAPSRYKLNNTMIVQDNATTESFYYEGWAVINKTAYQEVSSPDDFFTIYRNESIDTIASGTEFNMEYWFQPYRRRLSSGRFSTSDFLALHESSLAIYRNYWHDLLGDSDSYIKDNIGEQWVLLLDDYDNLELSLYFDGSGSQTIQVRTPTARGEPKISNGQLISYNATTGEITFTVTLNSLTTVSLSWSSDDDGSAGYFVLSVHVKQDAQPLSSVTVIVKPLAGSKEDSQNKTTNLQGLVQFELTYGSYLVKAYHDKKIKTMRVWLTSNKDVGFDFATPPYEPKAEFLVCVPIIAIVLYFFWRRR